MAKLQHRHLPKYNIGAHFLTAKTFKNIPYLRYAACARTFCEELEAARAGYGFHIIAFVVMPDHIHLILWWDTEALPDLTISKVAWAVKGRSARRIVEHLKGASKDTALACFSPEEDGKWVEDGNAVLHPTIAALHPETPGRLKPVRTPRDAPHYRN